MPEAQEKERPSLALQACVSHMTLTADFLVENFLIFFESFETYVVTKIVVLQSQNISNQKSKELNMKRSAMFVPMGKNKLEVMEKVMK